MIATLGGAAIAEPCAPAVRLDGDPVLVAEVARELAGRGIRVAVDDACPARRATVVRRGGEVVVTIVADDGTATERSITEAGTAASVIESFTRTDVATPLLATRAIPTTATPVVEPPRVEAPATPTAPPQRLHLAANLESAYANDGTTWLGASVKLCITVGPLCAAARFRSSLVVAGLDAPGVERDLNELLVGVDVPFALGPVRLAPGFAGGLGGMETRAGGMKRETGAFRAEAQVALWAPIVDGLALEASVGVGLGDQIEFDPSSSLAVPDPWVAVRGGVGLRYGLR